MVSRSLPGYQSARRAVFTLPFSINASDRRANPLAQHIAILLLNEDQETAFQLRRCWAAQFAVSESVAFQSAQRKESVDQALSMAHCKLFRRQAGAGSNATQISGT